MEITIKKGQIEDIAVIAQFQVDMAMESEGSLLNKETLNDELVKSWIKESYDFVVPNFRKQ